MSLEKQTEVNSNNHSKNKVLVVDDDKYTIDFCKFILEMNDFEVITSSNGFDAIKKIRRAETQSSNYRSNNVWNFRY